MKRLFMALVAGTMFFCCTAFAAPAEYVAVYPNGVFTELTTANYLKDSYTSNIALAYSTQDGLVEFDRFGFMIPSLAESWEVAEDNVTYTFHLRRGVKWHTWDGKEAADVVAQDFVDSARWILTKANASTHSNTVYNSIKNAREFYDGKITDFAEVGVRAVDAHTLRYILKAPLPYFVKQTSFTAFYPVNGKFLAEKGDQFGSSKENLLYCGAYFLTNFEPQQGRELTANPNYWNKDANAVETMTFIYNAESSALGAELFLRGEINDFVLPGSIVDEWMKDPGKRALMYPNNLTNMSYFIALNFEPNYGEEYAPGDWITAVNNLDFRKSLFHALDREGAIMTVEPFNPRRQLLNTLTRRGLVDVAGVDYTQLGGLKAYSDRESFDAARALDYKARALAALKGKVTFPLKVVMPYSTSNVEAANRMQIIEQQMENTLGTDYIDIILVSYPATGYNQEVRNPGKFSIMETGWGPDFADPFGSMDPMLSTALAPRYSRVYLARDIQDADGRSRFDKMAEAAAAEFKDMKKRYELFAEAETLLLDNALLIPFYTSGGGYRASYLDPFSGLTGQMGRFGAFKMKGLRILEKPVGMDGYPRALEEYEAQRVEAANAPR
jgi:oligopeptide transport system substrate-binding protein